MSAFMVEKAHERERSKDPRLTSCRTAQQWGDGMYIYTRPTLTSSIYPRNSVRALRQATISWFYLHRAVCSYVVAAYWLAMKVYHGRKEGCKEVESACSLYPLLHCVCNELPLCRWWLQGKRVERLKEAHKEGT